MTSLKILSDFYTIITEYSLKFSIFFSVYILQNFAHPHHRDVCYITCLLYSLKQTQYSPAVWHVTHASFCIPYNQSLTECVSVKIYFSLPLARNTTHLSARRISAVHRSSGVQQRSELSSYLQSGKLQYKIIKI
jgi:hypothetical protein